MTDETNESGLQKVNLQVFTNHKEKENMQTMSALLKMVYHVVLTNQLAIMQAKNKETGGEELVLVGVENSENGVSCYPLFAPLKAEDVAKYLAPDGSGGWIGEEVIVEE